MNSAVSSVPEGEEFGKLLSLLEQSTVEVFVIGD